MITRMIQTTGRRKKRVRSMLLSGAKRPDPPDRRPGHLIVTAIWAAAGRIRHGGGESFRPSGTRDTAPSVTRRYTVRALSEPASPLAGRRAFSPLLWQNRP
jgi:hypothetical protein